MKRIMATSAGISRHLHPTHPLPADVQVITALCDCLPRSVLWMTLLDAERQPGPPDFPTAAACRNVCSHGAPSFPAILTDRASHFCESLHLLFGAAGHAVIEVGGVSFCTDGVRSPLCVWARS